jgi:predicted SnoaL-like aldol condensation-catalyzing enzyme
MIDHKQIAVQFLQWVTEGNIDKAYEAYVDISGKHHNMYYPAGFPALKQGMKDNHIEFPDKQFTLKHVLGDGDFVAVHSHVVLKPKEKEVAVVHLFRFQGDKIVEMWDCGQLLSHGVINTDGPF